MNNLNKNDPVLNEYFKNLSHLNDKNKEENDMDNISNDIKIVDIKSIKNKKTAVIGMGQCGGNIASSIHENSILTCALNTSTEDLKNCNTDLKYKFENAKGSGKERSRSKDIFVANLDDFNNFFKKNFKETTNIIIIASASGGTGGGSAPLCAKFLKDNYPNKNIFLILILGSIYEDIKSQENMVSVMEEISKCEVNYLLFDNDSSDIDTVNNNVIDAIKFISREYFIESSTSNIDLADMQKLFIDNKRMIIVSGNFDSKISSKKDPNSQIINTINNCTQVKEIENPMSYAIFLSEKDSNIEVMNKLDKEMRILADEFGEPYEIYKHYQKGPDNAPDFTICITGLSEGVERYSMINKRLDEFNQRLNASSVRKISDIGKTTINARSYSGVKLPDEIESKDVIDKSSLDMFM